MLQQLFVLFFNKELEGRLIKKKFCFIFWWIFFENLQRCFYILWKTVLQCLTTVTQTIQKLHNITILIFIYLCTYQPIYPSCNTSKLHTACLCLLSPKRIPKGSGWLIGRKRSSPLQPVHSLPHSFKQTCQKLLLFLFSYDCNWIYIGIEPLVKTWFWHFLLVYTS